MPPAPAGEMRSLNSSNLLGCRYDAESQTLTVEFRSGHTFEYRNVPQAKYDGLISASSPGGYFHTQIKNSHPGSPVS